MTAAGVVAALDAEARTLGSRTRRGDGLGALPGGMLVAVSGMGWDAADKAARALVDAGVTGLVSFGMAGGLDPSLQAGTICLPSVVCTDDAEFSTDLHWREIVAAAQGARPTEGGKLLTSRVALVDVADKQAAFRATGAVAVDMESAAVASVAALHKLPFLAVRVIVDTAGDAVPRAVLAASTEGRVRIPRLILEVARAPRDLAPLLRLVKRYRAATRALAAVARSGALQPLELAAAPPARIA